MELTGDCRDSDASLRTVISDAADHWIHEIAESRSAEAVITML